MKTQYLLRYEYLKSIPAKPGAFDSHDNYEIFYFHEGQGYYLIGDTIHPLQPGTLIVMHGLTLHSPCSFDGIPYVRTLINFDQAYVRTVSRHLFNVRVLEPFECLGNYKVLLKEEEKLEFESILARMSAYHQQPDETAYERFKLSFLDGLLFIYSLLKKPVREQPAIPSGKERHIQQILTYIEQHLTENLSLDHMEKHLHVNKYHLSRLFHQVTGLTIFQYLLRRRLNQAKQLFLTHPEKSITDICYLSGFNNVSHFSKAFKQHEGYTPVQYRKGLL